jgi:hypothetical protein
MDGHGQPEMGLETADLNVPLLPNENWGAEWVKTLEN